MMGCRGLTLSHAAEEPDSYQPGGQRCLRNESTNDHCQDEEERDPVAPIRRNVRRLNIFRVRQLRSIQLRVGITPRRQQKILWSLVG